MSNDKKNFLKMSKERFSNIKEPAIFIENKDLDVNLVGVLLEKYNEKFNTLFYFDKKTNEIVNAGFDASNFAHYNNIMNLVERRGYLVSLTESKASSNGFVRLMESELDQAESILAAQHIVSKLQEIAEDVAKLISREVLPISEQMKDTFGIEISKNWQEKVKESLEDIFSVISENKDKISNQNLLLQRKLEGDVENNSDMDLAAIEDENEDAEEVDLDSEEDEEYSDFVRRKKDELPESRMKEGNEFIGALMKAKKAGEEEFEFNGKIYPVKNNSLKK